MNSNHKVKARGFYSALLSPLAEEIVKAFDIHNELVHLRYHFPATPSKDLYSAMKQLRRGGYISGRKLIKLTPTGAALKEQLMQKEAK